MMRAAILLLSLAAMLAACSSGSDTVYERLAPTMRQELLGSLFPEPAEPSGPNELSRAELNKIPSAVISLKLGDNPRAFVAPVTDNGGYLVYQDTARRGIVMHGGLITATHGFGYDLDAVLHRQDDPIAVPTPLSNWPASLTRNYSFMLRGQIPYEIAVTCALERGDRESVEIAELHFDVVQVVETCANPKRRFTNTYWVDPAAGFIWKSVQWIGPRIPSMTIEIV